MDCIFCKIVKGEIPSHKLYEDDLVLAFLDINPVNEGHSLVIPKKHFQDIFDIDQAHLERIIATAKRLAAKVKDELEADGVRISQSNGAAAGQAVFHYHMHVIPRYSHDGFSKSDVVTAHPSKADPEELQKVALQLRLE